MPKSSAGKNGHTFELMIVTAIQRNEAYDYKPQSVIGKKPNGRSLKADCIVWKKDSPHSRILISKKWQESDGTTEEKVPFEVGLLQTVVKNPNYTARTGGLIERVYVVLGGTDKNEHTKVKGWTLRDWFCSKSLGEIVYSPDVIVLKTEDLVARINQSRL